MKIPTSFPLGGQRIRVEHVEKLIHETDCQGLACYRENVIKIQTHENVLPFVMSRREQSFCHELVHFILWMMSESKLRTNEKFVDLFATFLHQALDGAIYDPPDKH